MHTKIYTYLLTLDNLSEILSEFQEFGEKLHFSNYGGVLFTVTTLGASHIAMCQSRQFAKYFHL